MLKSSRDFDYEWYSWNTGSFIQKYWKRKISYLTKDMLGEPNSVLDIGCGSSPTLSLFMGKKTGVDVSPEKLECLSKHTPMTTYCLDLERGMDIRGDFDAVICNNVLEHLANSEKVVMDISETLRPGSKVVLTVPNYSNVSVRLLEWAYGKFMPNSYAVYHISRFNQESLDSLCGKYKLRLITRKPVLTDMVCLYQKEV